MTFNIKDGIGDDLTSVSESIGLRKPVSVGHVLMTVGAAGAAAYLGIHVIRALGFRTDLGDAIGAVLGIISVDAGVKYLTTEEARQ